MQWLNSFWIQHRIVGSRRDLTRHRHTRQTWPNCYGIALEDLRALQKLTGIPPRKSFDFPAIETSIPQVVDIEFSHGGPVVGSNVSRSERVDLKSSSWLNAFPPVCLRAVSVIRALTAQSARRRFEGVEARDDVFFAAVRRNASRINAPN